MKEKDENIVFMVCGGDGDDRSQKWNQMVAEWRERKWTPFAFICMC